MYRVLGSIWFLWLVMTIVTSNNISHQMTTWLCRDEAFDHIMAGDEYRRQGNVTAAIAEFNAAAKIKPNDLAPHYKLAHLYRKQQQLGAAILEYREVIRIVNTTREGEPIDAAWAHYELGVLLAKRGDKSAARSEWQAAFDCSPIDVPQQAGIYQVHALAKEALAKPAR